MRVGSWGFRVQGSGLRIGNSCLERDELDFPDVRSPGVKCVVHQLFQEWGLQGFLIHRTHPSQFKSKSAAAATHLIAPFGQVCGPCSALRRLQTSSQADLRIQASSVTKSTSPTYAAPEESALCTSCFRNGGSGMGLDQRFLGGALVSVRRHSAV